MGQFDQTIDPVEGINLTPDPGLDPSAAAAPMLPAAMLTSALPPAPPSAPIPTPPPPQAPQGNLAHVIQAALLGLSAGLGPRSGVGTGLVGGLQLNNVIKEREQIHQQQLYHQQLQEGIQLQQLQEAQQKADDARQQKLQQALVTIRTEVKTIPDKATYDQRIEGYANLLRASGYRLDANWLRTAVPYFAPTAKQVAGDAITALFKNPLLQAQIKENPQAVATGFIMADLNGDGIKEKHSVQEMMDAAGLSFLTDESGKPVGLAAGTDGPMANIALKNSLLQFRAENHREPNPTEMSTLIEKARETPKEPKDQEMANIMKELAQQRLIDLKEKNKPTEVVEGTPDYRRAEDIAFGRLTLAQAKGLYSFKDKEKLRAILDKAEQVNPDFNAALFEQGYKFAANPKTQMAMASIASVEPNIDRLIALSDKWDRTKFPSFNAFLKAVKFQWGDRTVTNLEQLQTIVGDELGTALGSGSASDLKVELGLKMAGGNASAENFRSTLMEVKHALTNRKRGLLGQMGPYGQGPAAVSTDPAETARAKAKARQGQQP